MLALNQASLASFTDNQANSKTESNPKELKELKERIQKLEKDLSDQDKLIKGYQAENEKLYNELRLIKEIRNKETNKLEVEKNELKLNLIQEKLNSNKLRRSAETNTSFHQQKSARSKSPERKVILPVDAETETALLESQNRLNYMTEKNRELEAINKNLTQIVDYYEKNQQQIELDLKIIDSKNKEIKSLNDKVKYLEQSRVAPDYLKEIKRLKNQLKEMDLVVKRLRRSPNKDQASNVISQNQSINLSLDYYEQRIESLEAMLKDKSYDVERLNRMWKQKFYMLNEYKNFDKLADFEKAAEGYINKNAVEHDLERNYQYRIKVSLF